MAKFRISAVQTVIEECTVYIEAKDMAEAEEKAYGAAMECVDWRFQETSGDIEIVSIEEKPEKPVFQIQRDRGGYI